MRWIAILTILAAVLALASCKSRGEAGGIAQGLGAQSESIHNDVVQLLDFVANHPDFGEGHPLHTRLLQLADKTYDQSERSHRIETQWALINAEMTDILFAGLGELNISATASTDGTTNFSVGTGN